MRLRGFFLLREKCREKAVFYRLFYHFTKVRQLFCSLRLIEETPYPLLKADRVFLIAAS